MKKIIFNLLIAFVFLTGCKSEKKSDKIRVMTTIFPIYEFAGVVGGNFTDVSILLPPGAEAHSFDPKPRDIININESDLFIFIGEALEPWIHDILKSADLKKTHVLEVMEYFDSDDHDHHHDEEEHEHHHHGSDPHIWLDFEKNTKIVLLIAEKLSEIDPENSDYYYENAKNYIEKLIELDNKYQEVIQRSELKIIMYGGHFAFGHLAERYGLTHISPYSGFSPNSEPTPRRIAELIDTINKYGIEYLYFEELADPKVSRAIANETGVKMELLHAAHNLSKKEYDKKITFIQIMEENLEKLKLGLRYK